MEKGSINRERTIVANHQTAGIPQPGKRPLDHPAPFVTSKNATILWRRPATVQAERSDQLDAPLAQSASQGVKSHIPCRQSHAEVSAANVPPDAVDLRGSTRAPARRVAFPTERQSEGSFPEWFPTRVGLL